MECETQYVLTGGHDSELGEEKICFLLPAASVFNIMQSTHPSKVAEHDGHSTLMGYPLLSVIC